MDDVEKPNRDARDRVSNVVTAHTVTFVVVLAIATVALSVGSTLVARSVAEPINQLNEACKRILNDDLSAPIALEEARSAESATLSEAFAGMLVALRLGSESYVSGNLERARAVFSDALALYTRLEDRRGRGIAHNNLGNALLRMNQPAEAREHLQQAVGLAREGLARLQAKASGAPARDQNGADGNDIALRQLRSVQVSPASIVDAEGDPEREREHQLRRLQITLADRLANLAAAELELKNGAAALALLDEASEIDRRVDNFVGSASREGQRGRTLSKLGRTAEAARALEHALAWARENAQAAAEQDANVAAYRGVSLQFSLLNAGELALRQGDKATAAGLLAESAVAAPLCDIGALGRTLRLLKEAFAGEEKDAMQRRALVDQALRFAGFELNASAASGKDIVVALDTSGSMAGGRMQRALPCLMTVLDLVRNADRVAFVRFSQKSTVVVPLAPPFERLRETIVAAAKADGGTAFYDAVALDCLRLLREAPASSGRLQWIVALTDGEDNNSSIAHAQLKQLLAPPNQVPPTQGCAVA